jgi:hypothetical protein
MTKPTNVVVVAATVISVSASAFAHNSDKHYPVGRPTDKSIIDVSPHPGDLAGFTTVSMT